MRQIKIRDPATIANSETEMAVEIPESDIPKYEGLLAQGKEKLETLKSWKEKVDSPTPEFQEELRTVLKFCNAAFGIFRDHSQFNR